MPLRTDLLDFEREARQRAVGLEATGKLPAGFVDEHYALSPLEERELRRLKAALELADDADTFVALAKGRPLPRTDSWFRRRLADLQRQR